MNTISVSSSASASYTPQIIPTVSVSSTSTGTYTSNVSISPSVSPVRPPTIIVQENNITIKSDYVYTGAVAIGIIFIILIANIMDLRKKVKLAKVARSSAPVINPVSKV